MPIIIKINPKIKEAAQEQNTIFSKLFNLSKDFNEVLFLTDIEIRVSNPMKTVQKDEKIGIPKATHNTINFSKNKVYYKSQRSSVQRTSVDNDYFLKKLTLI